MNDRKEHKAYDGLEVRSRHILKEGKAWVTWAFEDWYYVNVKGTFHNGNAANGIYCRERAETVKEWLVAEYISVEYKGGATFRRKPR